MTDPPRIPKPVTEAPPTLWRELVDGTASVVVKLLVSVGLIPLFLGVGLVASFAVAGMIPGAMRGYGPDDDVVAVTLLLTGILYILAVTWVWTRQRRKYSAMWKAAGYTAGIVVGAIFLSILIAMNLRVGEEILVGAVLSFGGAGVFLVWTEAARSLARGQPVNDPTDGVIDVRCPACGYRMVGLRESRCPECGTAYTLDELLEKQLFLTRAHRRGVNPPPVPSGQRPSPEVVPASNGGS